MLLQKTDAPKVAPVYLRMVRAFPSPESLAAARLPRLSRLLSPLGLDYRADRLRRIGLALTSQYGGAVPSSEDALMSLPGIGRYIARAVCAQAFGQRKAVLDTNVIRVLGRYFAVRSVRPRARDDPRMWVLAQSMLPRRASDAAPWNWALLDFAACVCTSRSPAHAMCVLRHLCHSSRWCSALGDCSDSIRRRAPSYRSKSS